MATATCLPHAEVFTHTDAFSAAVAEDTLMLAGQLADALEILQQCHARNVALEEDFFEYVDDLTLRIQLMQPCRMIHTA